MKEIEKLLAPVAAELKQLDVRVTALEENETSSAAAALGRMTSAKKRKSSRRNGKLGGRPLRKTN